MSRVVMLAVNAKYVHSSLAVWCLASGVEHYAAYRHTVQVVEATINQNLADIVASVAAHEPDVVGISAYIWNAAMLPELLTRLREFLPDAILVLGGPEASHNAEHWLLYADHVLKGEGERSFPALLDRLAVDNGELKDGGKSTEFTVDEPVNPYSGAYFAALNNRIAYLETSRGCPFSCAFCLSGGTKPRFFPLDIAKEQLEQLARSGARTVKLVDRTFNCNAERAYELFEYVISMDTPVCFHFEAAADLFDDRTLALLKTAPPGRIQIEIGIQSFHAQTLEAVSRRTDLAKSESNIRTLLSGGNIHIHVDLIAGLPYETLQDFENSFDRAYVLGAHKLQLGFLKLLHGSVLRERAGDLGICYDPEPPYEITSSPWLSADDLSILKQAENALERAYNKARFHETLCYALPVSGLTPFTFYRRLGGTVPGHGEHLDAFAEKLYAYCISLPGIDSGILRDRMVCDWLRVTKGVNMPAFLRTCDPRKKQVAAVAMGTLGHSVGRCETAVLTGTFPNVGVFTDSMSRDPVTGLYALHTFEMA